MSNLKWVAAPVTASTKRHPRQLLNWLSEVVADTLAGNAKPSGSEQGANMTRFTPSPRPYSTSETAAEAGRAADVYARSIFGGAFHWFTRPEDHRSRLMVRYDPDGYYNEEGQACSPS